MKGIFIMVDGLNASGKSVILESFREWASFKNLKILDVKDYAIKNNFIPKFSDVQDYDVIISSEPTYALVGKAIRDEIIKENGRDYNALTTSYAFALDREILYKRLLIPALKADKIIFQDRGVVTSFVYQPVQERIPLHELMKLPGNKLALQYAPDLLIIIQVSPEIVMNRISKRGLNANTIFNNLLFQRRISERYNSLWLKELFQRFGTDVAYISTEPPKTEEDTKNSAKELLAKLLVEKKIHFD